MDLTPSVADLARDHGLDVGVPVSLRSTNNLVAWLRPSSVVAKVSRDSHASSRELQIVTFLAAVGAPVVPPIEIGLAQPVSMAGQWVTFWHYVADEGTATAASIAAALDALHAGLAKAPDHSTFPPCWNRLKTAANLLDDPELPGGLAVRDRARLRRALDDGIAALTSLSDPPHVLHGSPHRFNILAVEGEAVFIDLETVELGPLEWDLAHLDEEVVALYPADLDRDLLQRCRTAISAATSTWCWQGIDRGPDMRSHAEQHLEIVRQKLG